MMNQKERIENELKALLLKAQETLGATREASKEVGEEMATQHTEWQGIVAQLRELMETMESE